MRVPIAIIISLTYSISTYSQRVSSFSVDEGLPHSRIVALEEDLNGYLWIGTYGGGIARFDGRNFESFDESNGLISSVVLNVRPDSKGNVWITTPLGISRFNGKTFTNFKGDFIRGFFGFDVIEHHDTIFTVLRKDNLKLGAILGDSIVGKNLNFELQYPINKIFAVDDNTLYINLSNGDLLKKGSGIQKLGSKMKVSHFFKSRLGVHVLTPEGVFDIRSDSIVARYENFYADRVIVNDDFTYGWVRRGNSVSKLHFNGKKWNEESVPLPFNPSVIFIDQEGNDWFGTFGKGIVRYSPQNFARLDGGSISSSVYSFAADSDSNIWVGSNDGVSIYSRQGKFIHEIDFKDERKNRISSIALGSDNSLWLATNNGLAKVSSSGKVARWVTKANGLNGDSIRVIEVDDRGMLWIAYQNSNGLSVFDGIRNTRISTKDGLNEGMIWDLKYSRQHHTMFICTDVGIQKVSGKIFTPIEIPEFKDKILVSLGIYKNDYLLIGSGGSGLAIYNILNGTYSIITSKDGLASNFIYSVDSNQSDSIWVGTVKGIDLVVLDSQQKMKRSIHFNSQSGLGANGVNTNACFFYKNQAFFGLVDGAYKYSPNMQESGTSFPLHFVSVRSDVPVDVLTDSIFSTNQNAFEFIFKKVDKRGKSVRYQYRLINWDKDWISSSDNTKVNYSNLPPGKYKFFVQAANLENQVVDEISFSFNILFPFYQQLWFRLALLVAIVLIILSVIYIRVRIDVSQVLVAEKAKVEEGVRLRKEISRDFHDEMGNQLARIINYLGLLKMPSYPDKDFVLDKAVETAKYLLTGTKDFLWSIDPIHDNLESLSVHVRDFAERLMDEKGIEFRFFSNVSDNHSFPFGYTRQINLIFKEALTNVFKHSGASRVDLSIKMFDKELIIELADNGLGLGSEAYSKGDGIKNMLNRTSKLKGNLSIVNNNASPGVTVKLILTLND